MCHKHVGKGRDDCEHGICKKKFHLDRKNAAQRPLQGTLASSRGLYVWHVHQILSELKVKSNMICLREFFYRSFPVTHSPPLTQVLQFELERGANQHYANLQRYLK